MQRKKRLHYFGVMWLLSLLILITTLAQAQVPNHADFTGWPVDGIAPQTVDYVLRFDSAVTEYNINKGAGFSGWVSKQSLSTTVSYTFNTPGTYTVQLAVRGTFGEQTITKTDYIHVYEKYSFPEFASVGDNDFASFPRSGRAPLLVYYYLKFAPDVTHWNFDCGPGWGSYVPTYNRATIGTYNLTSPGRYTVKMAVKGTLGEFSTTKEEYITVYPSSSSIADTDLPVIKQMKNETIPLAYELDDYAPNGYDCNYWINNNFMDKASLSGDSVALGPISVTTSGINVFDCYAGSYALNHLNGRVKVSTYRINRLPQVSLKVGETVDFNIGDYTFNSNGKAIPPSYGGIGSLLVSDTTYITAYWLNNKTIRITALSAISTLNKPLYIEILASPSSFTPFVDYDRERLPIYFNKINVGNFTNKSGFLSEYAIQTFEDKPDLPMMTYPEKGELRLTFSSPSQSLWMMPNLDKLPTYKTNKWYMARIKVKANNSWTNVDVGLFNFKGFIPNAQQVNLACNMIFSIPTSWTTIETPLYVHVGDVGYPQIYIRNQGWLGSVQVKDLEIFEAVPNLLETRTGNSVYKGTFASLSGLSTSWGIEGNAPFTVYEPNGIQMNLTEGERKYLKLTAKQGDFGVYTPPAQVGKQVGMKVQIPKTVLTGSYLSYDTHLLLACFGVKEEGSFDIAAKGTQMLASAEMGVMTDSVDSGSQGYHYLAGNAMCPYYQMQCEPSTHMAGTFKIKNIEFLADQDEPFYGDESLF